MEKMERLRIWRSRKVMDNHLKYSMGILITTTVMIFLQMFSDSIYKFVMMAGGGRR